MSGVRTTTTATASIEPEGFIGMPSGPIPMDGVVRVLDRLRELLVVQPEQRLFWVAVAALAIFGGWALSRAGRPSSTPRPVRGLLSVGVSLLRGVVLVVGALLVASLVPVWLAPAILLAAAAAATAIGWSLRDVLPDVVAAAWLVVERRIRSGTALLGPEEVGVVERLGLRAVSLRTPAGHLILIPNRRLLSGAYRLDTERWPRVRVEVWTPKGATGAAVREALRDAVLTSPDVPAEPRVQVDQDPLEPRRWRVQARIVHMSRAHKFEGELQARLQAFLSPKARDTKEGSRPGGLTG
ncbi:MAG TPA: mechanosensitive ion channel family protein [Myxococcales bacterium LLY-WYZ-16_1]|nr:mechanosensitive ion channel family protein [Myxococcales bacterium LLY-WYZ-16_1]